MRCLSVRWSRRALVAAVAVLLAADAGLLAGDEPAPRTDLHGDPLPAGVVVRLGTSRYRNESGVSGLVFAGDGQSLFAAAPDGHVAVLEVATGRRVREFGSEGHSIAGLRLAPDRQTILTIGDASIKSWGSATGEALARVPVIDVANLVTPRGAAFDISRDGKLIVTGNQRGTLTVSDVATGKLLAQLKFDRLPIQTVVVSPDGTLVVAGARNDLIFWEWQTEGAPVRMRLGRNVLTLAFSPDGALLAEGPDSREDVVVRDVASRQVLRRFSDPNAKFLMVPSLVFTADAKHLVAAIASDTLGKPPANGIHVWDVATGEIRRQFFTGAEKPSCLALSEDGRWLAARIGGSLLPGGSIRIWDLRIGETLGDDLPSHMTDIATTLYSPDGRTIVTAGRDGTIRVWEASTGRQMKVLRHERIVNAVSVSPDGALIASSSLDNTVRLWETATGKELHRFPGHGETGGQRAVAFSSDGERFASWGDDLILRVRDVKTGVVVSERHVHPREIPPPDENEDAARRAERLSSQVGMISQVLFSADAQRLAIQLRAGKTYLFDGMTGEELDVLELPDGRVFGFGLALSPDGTRLATSAQQQVAAGNPPAVRGPGAPRNGRQIIRVREIATDTEVFQVALPEWGLGPIAFSADGRHLGIAIRGPPFKVRVLDAATGAVSAEFDGSRQRPESLAFSPDGKRLACGLSDGTALIWDLSTIPAPQP